MRTLAQTGNGWMTFKDTSATATCNQSGGCDGNVVHLSNLCTEILEVTSNDGDGCLQPGLHQPRQAPSRPTATSSTSTRARAPWCVTAVQVQLDPRHRPQPLPHSRSSPPLPTHGWRPIGLGVHGAYRTSSSSLPLLPFDSGPRRCDLCPPAVSQEDDLLHAVARLVRSWPRRHGPHHCLLRGDARPPTRAALQFDLWGVTPTEPARALGWDLRAQRIAEARTAQLAC